MDRMTELAMSPTVRKLVSKMQLPITLPTVVRRTPEQDAQRPLLGRRVLLTVDMPLAAATVRSLSALGASFVFWGGEAATTGAADLARSAGRPTEVAIGGAFAAALSGREKVDAVIADVAALGGMRNLFAQLQPLLSGLTPHCRVTLVNRVSQDPSPAQEAEVEGVFGFAKSLARELGKKAITVNVLDIHAGCEEVSVALTLGFLSSDRARYVTSQRLVLSPRKAPPASLMLTGEHALITGGARGIGASIAKVLAQRGAKITLVDLANARDGASEVCAAITREGGKAHFVPCDVTKADEVAATVAAATHAYGPVQVLINNAGITRDKTFAKMTEAQWSQVLAVNYEAGVRLTEHIMQSHVPRTVFLSSVVGLAGNFGQTNYTLSKAAVAGYVHGLARKNPEMQITAVAPGFIDTALTREIPFLNREVAKQMISLLQAGEPQDIADVVSYLASPAAAAFSGETLRVCGGMFVGR